MVTVVDISSPSYTGTTWLCLLLGSHPRAFALGPPDRVWGLRGTGWDDACRVHGRDCGFWPAFHSMYDPGENLYLQLAAHSGRDVIVINNPTPAHRAAELRHPDLLLRRVQLVRDGRAVALSYARHHRVDFYDAVVRYARPMYADFAFETDRDDVVAIRYEDLVDDQAAHVARFGTFLGLDYPDDATRFWEHDHHITSGNAGAISLLKNFQGIDARAGKNDAFYRAQFEQMRTTGERFRDERWRDELGRRERFVFDFFCGRANAAWGYDEDAFTTRERERFDRDLSAERRPVRTWAAARTASLRRTARRAAHAAAALPRSRRRLVVAAAIAWVATVAATWVLASIYAG